MKTITLEEIQTLATDEASLKSAKSLVNPSKWPTLGQSDQALWGECQGSGTKPYQVQFDSNGSAFRCSCPSRKFPCKHGLALTFLALDHPGQFKTGSPPPWVEEWLESRRSKAEKASQLALKPKATQAPSQAPQAGLQRERERNQRRLEGTAELQQWLIDKAQQGLAVLPKDPAPWRQLAARMVDAQLPGLSSRLLAVAHSVNHLNDWHTHVLGAMGEIQLLLDAYARLEQLPKDVQADVGSALGDTVDKVNVFQNTLPISDQWCVMGVNVFEEGHLWVRRAWLFGRTLGRDALLLDFSHGHARFEPALVAGTSLQATLHYYPGNVPLRAVASDLTTSDVAAPPLIWSANHQNLYALSRGIAGNPWQSPQILRLNAYLVKEESTWMLLTPEENAFVLSLSDEDGWHLLAQNGGGLTHWFGEWNGRTYLPLSAWLSEMIWRRSGQTGAFR